MKDDLDDPLSEDEFSDNDTKNVKFWFSNLKIPSKIHVIIQLS